MPEARTDRLRRLLRPGRLVRCCRGVALTEFALSAPILFLAVMGVIELAMMMFVTTLMEGGLREAARFGITGYTPPGVTREDRIREIVAEHMVGLIDASAITITQLIYPSFSDVGKPEPFGDTNGNGSYDAGEPYTDVNGNGQWDADMGAAGIGGPGDIVLYTVKADWSTLTPYMAPLFGADGGVPLKASVVVRNEPYDPILGGGGAP